MPRRTHTARKGGHSRAHVIAQRERVAKKRFRAAKQRYPYTYTTSERWQRRGRYLVNDAEGSRAPIFVHPDDALRDPDGVGYGYWPFARSWTQWADSNPFTQCSCWACSADPDLPGRRRAEEKRALEEAWEAAEAYLHGES